MRQDYYERSHSYSINDKVSFSKLQAAIFTTTSYRAKRLKQSAKDSYVYV